MHGVAFRFGSVGGASGGAGSGGDAVGGAGAGFARFRGAAALAAAGGALAVEASAENSDDGKDVLDELGFGGGVRVVLVHDDFRSVLVENELDEIECEPTEPVSVGNKHVS